MKQMNIDREIRTLQNKSQTIQNKLWKLYGIQSKQDIDEFLKSGILSTMKWRVRTYYKVSATFLEYYGDKKVEAVNKIVSYPHDHKVLAKGMTLNQDDGNITLTFDTPYLMLKYIKQYNLKTTEWINLTDMMKSLRQYKRLEKYLKTNFGEE